MDGIECLVAERACEKVIIDLTRTVDELRFDEALTLFTDDAVFVRRGIPLEGKNAIAEAFAARPKNQITRHFLANISIELEDEKNAKAVSSVFVFRHLGTDAPPELPVPLMPPDTVGEYRDTLVLEGQRWKICRRETLEVFSA